MKGYVNGIDWINAEAMKYWSHTAATPPEKRKQEIRNAVFSNEYYGALKIDGYYERLVKDEDGNCFMIARSKNVHGEAVDKIDWVPQLKTFMESLPNGTVFLSECWLPDNEGSKKITSLLGCLKEKCIARQEKGQKLHFYIFDVMAYDGEDFTKMPFEQRIEKLHGLSHIHMHSFVEYAQYYSGAQLWDKLQQDLADGREGMVIMRKDAPVYFKRTPARVSFKVKKETAETLDCFFTGKATPPSKDYHGKEIESWQYWVNQETDEHLPIGNHYYEAFMNGLPYIPVTKPYYMGYAGSLEIGLVKKADGRCRLNNGVWTSDWVDGLNIVSIGYLSGLTDEIKMNYKDYTGRVIEVGAMELNDTGGLRHAKMLGWRNDKQWFECEIEQLKDL